MMSLQYKLDTDWGKGSAIALRSEHQRSPGAGWGLAFVNQFGRPHASSAVVHAG